jgi:hypothetical protein
MVACGSGRQRWLLHDAAKVLEGSPLLPDDGICAPNPHVPSAIGPAEPEWSMVDWTKPEYSRSAVKRAGKVLVTHGVGSHDLYEAIQVINNWRSAHGYALNSLTVLLRDNAQKVDDAAVIVQRLKRLHSIRAKLERTNLDLLQMQDIGGCRAVVSNVDSVLRIVGRLFRSRTKHQLIDFDDYITEPKKSGYRSFHLMFKHQSAARTEFNGLRIELQVRTALQHAWATAVEAVGLFTQQDLKGSLGDHRWLDFFALMGTELALREGTEPIPGTPDTRSGVRAALREVERELDAIPKLQAYGIALKEIEDATAWPAASFFLLELDVAKNELRVTGFSHREQTQAQAAYERAEAQASVAAGVDTVLVTADSMDALRRAYPNYFADTTKFVQAVRRAID